ncbi:MAG TPA: Fic family protein [Nocardioides sp.]|uniref:Fic family protein n=1 Tax=Nocardioides sp. TaxID=35761 RepID=UPI002ED7A29D
MVKTPLPPPATSTLLDAARRNDRLAAVFQALPEVSGGPYLAWDKLRHKEPPGDLTPEEWWLATKVARQAARKMLPTLIDLRHQPFSYVLADEVLEGVDFINRHASGSITISEQVTNATTRDRYVVNSLIEEAITSSQLEGAATSRRVAKEMIRSGRDPRDRGERMIFNNFHAMQRIVDLKEEPLTPALICEIHRIVTDGTLDDPLSAGKIQDDDADRVAVWGDGQQLLHQPPPVAELPQRMEALCDFANGQTPDGFMPPVLRAITVHFMMGFDHYFEDGNGRTARALFYWTLLHNGYWLAEFLTISRILKQAPSQYAQAYLHSEYDEGDLTHFFIYNVKVISRAINDLHAYLAAKAAELNEFRRRAAAGPVGLNHRQVALLEHAVKNPGQDYTAASHARSHRVSEQAARNDLRDLERQGLLTWHKLGRQHAWTAPEDLPARLVDA